MGATLMPTHEHAARLACTCVAAKQQPGICRISKRSRKGSPAPRARQLQGTTARNRICKKVPTKHGSCKAAARNRICKRSRARFCHAEQGSPNHCRMVRRRAQVPKRVLTPKLRLQRNSLQRSRPARQACFRSSRSSRFACPGRRGRGPHGRTRPGTLAEQVEQAQGAEREGRQAEQSCQGAQSSPQKEDRAETETGRHGPQGQERNDEAADKWQHGGKRPHHSGEMFRVHMPEQPELAREVAWREKGQSLLLEVWSGRGMGPAQGICAWLVARLDPPMSHVYR